jgi:hypothetical protein
LPWSLHIRRLISIRAYAEAVLRHHNNGGPVDYRLLTLNLFWDFGHLASIRLAILCDYAIGYIGVYCSFVADL